MKNIILSGAQTHKSAHASVASISRQHSRLQQYVVRYALFIGFVCMCIMFSLLTPWFLTVGNFVNIALSSAVLLIVAVPMGFLIITAAVDLSVGSIVGLSAVVTGLLINAGVYWLLAALAGIGIGAGIGAFNGAIVAITRFDPIVVTLGMLQAVRGIARQLTNRPPSNFGDAMNFIGRGEVIGIPVLVWIALVVFAVGVIVLHFTPTGRHIYGVGINSSASFLSGLKTKRLRFLIFIAVGAASGLGGVLYAARLDSAPPATLGAGFELQVLTAVLLGGVAFNGGKGTITGVLLGVIFIGVLQNGLLLLNVSTSGQMFAIGAALVVAAGLEVLSGRRGTR